MKPSNPYTTFALLNRIEHGEESTEMLLRSFIWLVLTQNLLGNPLDAETPREQEVSAVSAEESFYFDIPSLDAEVAFKRFLDVVDVPLVYILDEINGITLNSIKGKMSPDEAIGRLVQNTELFTHRDQLSGTTVIKRVDRVADSEKKTADGLVQQTSPLDRNMKTNANTKKNHWFKTLATLLTLGAATANGQTGSSETEAGEAIYELSPFTVSAGENTGYLATSTLAGTRLKTDLKDVGAAVSVYTQEFLEDTDALKIEELLTFTTSTEGGGVYGNWSGGITGESGDEQRSNPSATIRVRALADATRTRDYFASDIPSDAYNISAVTISRGPNAILAGIGAPGGVVDVALNRARFDDEFSVDFQFGKHGSYRTELHANRELIEGRLAIRIDVLDEDRKFRQDPAYAEDSRFYTAATWKIDEGKREGFLAGTTLHANFEKGEIDGIPPNTLTPVMAVSSWFPDDHTTANPYWRVNAFSGEYFDQNGNPIERDIGNSNEYTAWLRWQDPNFTVLDGFPMFRQWGLVWDDASSSAANVGVGGIQGFQGVVRGGTPRGNVRGTGDFGRNAAGYFRPRLTNPETFDFYNHLMTGGLDTRSQDFDALDVRLEQLFADGNLGVELAYNKQNFERSDDMPVTGAGTGSNEIMIDVNTTLPVGNDQYPDGIPNPNFGRPFIRTFSVFDKNVNISDDESFQMTAFAKHNFKDHLDGWAGNVLGRHTLTGYYFSTEQARATRRATAYFTDLGSLKVTDSLATRVGTFRTQVNGWWYIGDSQIGNDLSELRLNPVTGGKPVPREAYTLTVFDPPSDSFLTGTGVPVEGFATYRDESEEIKSAVFALQSHWLDNHLVTLVGWREDQSDTLTSTDAPLQDDGTLDLSEYRLVPSSSQRKESPTYSVVAKFPEEYLFELPWESDLSLTWNQSENFNPVGQRRNIYNEEVGSPSTETEEFGATVSVLQNKLNFRVTRYETQINDASIGGTTDPSGYVRGLIGRMLDAQQLDLIPADWGYTGFADFNEVAQAFFNIMPDRLQENTGSQFNYNPRFVTVEGELDFENDSIVNRTSVSSVLSKGWEYEGVWNPTPNWRIAFNAAKMEAAREDIAVLELQFSDEVLAKAESLYGAAFLQASRNPAQDQDGSWTNQYLAEQVSRNQSLNQQSGSPTPEIREWRFNLLTNYKFTEGALKDVSVGAAYRWLDDAATGFPLIDFQGSEISDVNNPYFGPKEDYLDLNVRYQRDVKLLGRDVMWKVRLQVNNVLGDDKLIVINTNPDGSGGNFRIAPEPRVWSLSNTLEF